MYNAKNFFLGGASLSFVNLAQKAINFLLLPVFTFYMTPTEFGYMGVYFLVIAGLSTLYNPGVISSTTRLFYDSEKTSIENRRLVGSSMIFLIALPFLVIGLSIIWGEEIFNIFFDKINFWPFGFLAVCAAAMIQPVRLWVAYYVILGKTKIIALWSFIQLILSVGFSVILVVGYDLGATGRIFGLLLGNFMLFCCSIYFVFVKVGFAFSLHKIGYVLKKGFPLIIGVFAYVILDMSDRYMITEYLGLEKLGMYDISYTISSIPLFIILGFNQVWQPVLFENMKSKNYDLINKIVLYFVSGFTIITSGIILFSNEIFNLFLNSNFLDGMIIVPWILLGIFFLGLTNFLNSILMYDKKFSLTGVVSMTAATLNILFNIFLIPKYGILGAAISTFLAYFIYCSILILITFKKVYKLFSFKKLFFLILFLVLTTIGVFYLNITYRSLHLFITSGKVFYFLIFIGSVIFLLFTTELRFVKLYITRKMFS